MQYLFIILENPGKNKSEILCCAVKKKNFLWISKIYCRKTVLWKGYATLKSKLVLYCQAEQNRLQIFVMEGDSIKKTMTRGGTMLIKDMTHGPCIKLILTFALPLFIGNIFQQIYNLVDTAVVGHCIGDSAISAIGTTSSLYILLISLVTCLNSGYAIITTQSFGARDESRIRKCIAGTILLNAVATLVITVLAVVFLRPLLVFMNTPESIFEDAYRYIMIICVGMFSTVGYNMFAGILRAVGNSRTPLYCLIVSSLINVGLDILFVAGFHPYTASPACVAALT